MGTTSTTRSPAALARRSADGRDQLGHLGADPGDAEVRQDGHRHAREVERPEPGLPPPTPGRLSGSRWSNPLQASKYRAVSRTDRVRQPSTVVIGSMLPSGPLGIRP